MNNRTKLFIPIAFFFGMLGLLWYGLYQNPNAVPSALVNRPMPQFSKPDLLDPTRSVGSDQLKDGIFLVNVWATWCAPCHVEHPYLVELSEEQDDVTLIGVNYKDDVEAAREFLDERGNPFAFIATDLNGTLGIDLGVSGAPESFLVDASGMIRYKHIGIIDDQVWTTVFEPLIRVIQREQQL